MKKPCRATLGEMCGNPRLRIHVPESRPSWRRFGEGVANVEFTFYAASGTLSIDAEETAFASKAAGESRDVTKRAMMDLDKAAATALRDALDAWLGEAG